MRKDTDFKRKVNTFLLAGWKLDEIADHFGISRKSLYNYYKLKYTYKVVTMGYKNETYATEEEMIQGYKVPTFEELSNDEKILYMAL